MTLTAETIHELAARHGLTLVGAHTVNELGLDYRVVLATAADGQRWVLRIPRRAGMHERIMAEARALGALRDALPFAVPDWRVVTDELIAYPMLPDAPALLMDAPTAAPRWTVPQDSAPFAESFAAALAALHAVPLDAAAAAGMSVHTPEQARARVAEIVVRVSDALPVHPDRLWRWRRWLDDDSLWPPFCTVVHGDLYVGHVLVDHNERVSGMIDWSEARVDDPSIDMTSHLMVFGEQGLSALLERYQAHGGRVWPTLARHTRERLALAPAMYALFGLENDAPEHLDAAKAQLMSPE